MVFARHEKVVERADDEAVHEAHHTAPQQRVGAELTVDRVVNRLIGVPVRGLERGLRELVGRRQAVLQPADGRAQPLRVLGRARRGGMRGLRGVYVRRGLRAMFFLTPT